MEQGKHKVRPNVSGDHTYRAPSGEHAAASLHDRIIGEPRLKDFWLLSPGTAIQQVRDGLSIQQFEELRAVFRLPIEQMAAKIGMSKATLHRRQAIGRLNQDESDKLMRFGRLLVMAVAVFESEETARQWLSSPQHGLGGAVPLDYAETEIGAREVEDLLGRIEHGVYS